MCLDKYYIDLSTRSKYYFPGYAHLSTLDVPCCQCDECISHAQNDIYIRMHSEYVDCVKNGGLVVFVTFTFSDDNVPSYSYKLDNGEVSFYKVPYNKHDDTFIFGFDKKLMQKFFNSYRKFLSRCDIDNPQIRYIVVPEYGTDNRYTQRPHYHSFLFLNKDVVKFYSKYGYFNERLFMNHIRKYWTYGKCSESKNHGLTVYRSDGIKYLSKYVSKTILLKNLRRFKKFFEFIELNIDLIDPTEYKYNKSVYGIFKYYLKKSGSNLFILKSKNFGVSAITKLLEYRQNKDYDALFREYEKGYKIISNGMVTYIPYSMYYYRKLFFDTRTDGSFYLNSAGYRYTEFDARNRYFDELERINQLDFDNLSTMSDSDGFEIGYVKSLANNKEFIKYYLLYTKFVRGRSFPLYESKYIKKLFTDRSVNSLTELVKYLVKLNYGYIFTFDDVDLEIGDYSEKFRDYLKEHPFTFSDPIYIIDYEVFYKNHNILVNHNKKIRYEENRIKFENSKALRDFVNHNY